MSGLEKREFKRLPLSLDISCLKVGATPDKFHTGCTVNVSPGGLFFETTNDSIESGSLLKVELSIPPTAGLLRFGGKISAFAKVLRTSDLSHSCTEMDIFSSKYGVALQFCQSPKLTS